MGEYALPNITEESNPPRSVVDAEFDAYSGSYSEKVNEAVAFSGLDVDFFTRVKAGYIVDFCRRRFDDIGACTLLDVGCGVGNFHPLLAPHFGQLHGVDVSAACIEEARMRNTNVAYSTYDGNRLPYDDGTFDIAIAVCVMHHVPVSQRPQFMGEIARVLRPGGHALVFEHNPFNPLTRHVVKSCPFDEDAVLLNAREVRTLFDAAGLRGARDRFILAIPAATRMLRRVDGLFSRLPIGAQYFSSAQK